MRNSIRISLFAFFSLLLSATSFAQNPVKWSFSTKDAGNCQVDLIFTGTIDEGWYTYSQFLESEDGPVKTSFNFDDQNNIQLLGKNVETGDIKKVKDEMFDMNVIKIKNKGVFTQKVKVKDITKLITGTIEYMCCNDMQCLPPKSVPFSISLATAQ